jgi:hypothetical protein
MNVRLDTTAISDWRSFHNAFKEVMGFPDFYGANMDAWIDCMSHLDDGKSGMLRFDLGSGEALEIEIVDAESFARRVPDILVELIVCTAIINRRYLETAGEPVVSLVFV